MSGIVQFFMKSSSFVPGTVCLGRSSFVTGLLCLGRSTILSGKVPLSLRASTFLKHGIDTGCATVRKLDLSHLCFSSNFYFSMFLRLFPSMFPC